MQIELKLADHIPGERWLPIAGAHGYEVSDHGRILSNKPRKFKTRILRLESTSKGYLRISLRVGGKVKHLRVHRLVALHFGAKRHGDKDCFGGEVNHIDGNKRNNHHLNLEWITRSDNCKHMYASGLRKPLRGSKCGRSKLTEEQVLDIRRDYSREKANSLELSKKYGVTQSALIKAATGLTWRHL